MLDTICLELRLVPVRLLAVLLLAVILVAGNGPSHSQEPDGGEATQQEEPAEPVVTRAWAHDDFGRIVFDWPRAVGYDARIEGKTLTVMFDHQLKTTFWQIRRYLGAYITDVDLAPDGRRVTASLTDDYRLRTFTLSSESGVAKVVVDMLADGGAGPVLAQAQADSPLPEPTPAAVPGDTPPQVPGDTSVTADPPPQPQPEPTPEPIPEAVPVDAPSVAADPAPQPELHPLPSPLPEREGKTAAPTTESAAEPAAAETEAPSEAAPPAEVEAPSVDAPPTEGEGRLPDPPPAQPLAIPPPSIPAAVVAEQAPEIEPTPSLLSIPVSQSRLFRLDVPVASVFVANPEIADVQLVSSGVLFVVGKAVGRTSVAALDADSNLIAEWTIATVIDVEPVRAALKEVEALKNVSVRQLNRGVELSGVVASIAEADLALRLTTTALPEEVLVQNRITVSGAQQINLEVLIAEVQRSVSETLGINWEVLPDLAGDSVVGFRVGRFFFDEAANTFLSTDLPGGRAASVFGSGIAGRTTVRGLIDALATAGLATVLARPNVTAISGETASFFSGGEYPLPAGFEDGAIIFEYKKYGVLLDFVPTVVDNGRIVLTVRPEVSQRSETDSLKVIGIDIPVINVRRAETTVEVGNGESIVIAGLYRDQAEAVEAGVPVLKDIPLVNLLFGTRTVRSNATELIVVVTARLTDAAPVSGPVNRQAPGRRLRGYHY